MATVGIGREYAMLELPAVFAFVMTLAIHLTAVRATWLGVRSNPRRRNALRQGVLSFAAILMVVGAIATHARLGRFDLLAVIIGGVVSGAGPLLMAVVLFPAPEKTPDPSRQG